ncbi:hypothetical protein NJF44_10665 [Pseudomonas guariconensis]|uniref:hypothetical protein n=1 Tax=Pseudomonas TaxID=286 RepID=UPI002096975F|nr:MULTISPECIES: hypothetical protein [Pseudomonas]MCO7515716.1 hypothetical protein [Pseudomonas putida]MCO7605691.1 hypothetical protein [Pseudomonas guariconensis]
MSYVVYSDSDAIEKVQGITYRKIAQFYGVVSGATGVFVGGDAEAIVEAYEAAGIQILGELPTSPPAPPGAQVNWGDIQGKPDLLQIGTTADTAAAGNHNHAITAHAGSGLAAAANLQAGFQAMSTRVKALEDAAAG